MLESGEAISAGWLTLLQFSKLGRSKSSDVKKYFAQLADASESLHGRQIEVVRVAFCIGQQLTDTHLRRAALKSWFATLDM